MATLYTTVNKAFLRKITDLRLSGMEDADLEAQCTEYRESAIAHFYKCKKDLTLQDVSGFTETLSSIEVEIIAHLMVLEWLTPQVNSFELLRQALGNREFQLSSQANHLEKLEALQKSTEVKISRLLVDYTYAKD